MDEVFVPKEFMKTINETMLRNERVRPLKNNTNNQIQNRMVAR